ncbi:MAG TPA: hypothetical protein VGA70_07690 [Longimicrobiales bacterium]|jgi:heme-degrading monooxygenase HmoA
MIVRFWRGRTLAGDADAYTDYMHETGIKAQRATPGNLASSILRRDEGTEVHFAVLSLWESWDAIRAFAGDAIETAVYFPEDRKYLLVLEPTVVHWEVPVWEAAEALVTHDRRTSA